MTPARHQSHRSQTQRPPAARTTATPWRSSLSSLAALASSRRSLRSWSPVASRRYRRRPRRPPEATAPAGRAIDQHAAEQTARIDALDREERAVARELTALVKLSGSTLAELRGIAARSAAELLVEVGDPRRFTEGGFARFNGSAPLPCSSGEGAGESVRHRFNPHGNRRVNCVLHHMALTQLRGDPRARQLYDHARQRGHTKPEAMRVLKRRLSDLVHRRMIRDLEGAARAA
jgi:transposase